MEISDLFTSFQGEGPMAGKPSVFVRLRRCNLACTWCDTKYTWDATHPEYMDFQNLTPKDLADQLSVMLYESAATNLVVTGGEPLLWRSDLMTTFDLMELPPETIEIETNGTVAPLPAEYDRAYYIRYNVSPKLWHAGNLGRVVRDDKVIEVLAKRSSIFKFVVSGERDYSEMQDWVKSLKQLGVSSSRVFLMPLGRTVEELNSRVHLVAEMAERLGVVATDRMHIREYGDKRGV